MCDTSIIPVEQTVKTNIIVFVVTPKPNLIKITKCLRFP